MSHGHSDGEPCGMYCPVGGADGAVRIHLNDGCNHRYGNVCPACAELTDEEVAAIREYFALHAALHTHGKSGNE